ncbi:EthD domain-containing protein [Pseudonocardia sp. RS010]|uniref:EthD domain-containing protein n=1 Tax=Pseudonocardia sp. RS010 TaxID=3385979 RepID=UPI0039A07748
MHSGPVKVVVLGRRSSGLPLDRFRAWAAAELAPGLAGLAGAVRQAQSLTLLGGYRSGDPIYDVVHELWFPDEAAARWASSSPAFTALTSDRALDPASLTVLHVEEHVIKDLDEPTGGVKSIEFVARRADLPCSEFRRYWREVHGPLAARIAPIQGYVQSHCLPSCYTAGAAPRWDGLATTWFDDTAAMRRSATLPEYRATREDEPRFLAPGHLPFLITTETVTVDSPTPPSAPGAS